MWEWAYFSKFLVNVKENFMSENIAECFSEEDRERAWCLALASAAFHVDYNQRHEIVGVAQQFHDFVRGKGDAKILDAAREFVKKMGE